jgi:hypothetical protein
MWHCWEHDYTPLEKSYLFKKYQNQSTKLVIEIPNFDSTSRKIWRELGGLAYTATYIVVFFSNIELLLSGWNVSKIVLLTGRWLYLLCYWMSRNGIKRGIKVG